MAWEVCINPAIKRTSPLLQKSRHKHNGDKMETWESRYTNSNDDYQKVLIEQLEAHDKKFKVLRWEIFGGGMFISLQYGCQRTAKHLW